MASLSSSFKLPSLVLVPWFSSSTPSLLAPPPNSQLPYLIIINSRFSVSSLSSSLKLHSFAFRSSFPLFTSSAPFPLSPQPCPPVLRFLSVPSLTLTASLLISHLQSIPLLFTPWVSSWTPSSQLPRSLPFSASLTSSSQSSLVSSFHSLPPKFSSLLLAPSFLSFSRSSLKKFLPPRLRVPYFLVCLRYHLFSSLLLIPHRQISFFLLPIFLSFRSSLTAPPRSSRFSLPSSPPPSNPDLCYTFHFILNTRFLLSASHSWSVVLSSSNPSP